MDQPLSAYEDLASSPAQIRDLHRGDLAGADTEAR
jgi:hypothetical protein